MRVKIIVALSSCNFSIPPSVSPAVSTRHRNVGAIIRVIVHVIVRAAELKYD